MLCRHKRGQRQSVVREDREVRPAEREVETSNPRSEPARHKDRRLSLQIHTYQTSGLTAVFPHSQVLETKSNPEKDDPVQRDRNVLTAFSFSPKLPFLNWISVALPTTARSWLQTGTLRLMCVNSSFFCLKATNITLLSHVHQQLRAMIIIIFHVSNKNVDLPHW